MGGARHATGRPGLLGLLGLLLLVGCASHGDGSAAEELRIVDIAPGPSGCAVWSDGHVECWRGGQPRAPVAGLRDAVELTDLLESEQKACARRRGGQVVCWRLDDLSVTRPVEGLDKTTMIDGWGATLCATVEGERLRCVELVEGAEAELEAAMPGARDLAVGAEICAATEEGVRCVGDDGESTRVTGIEGAIEVALSGRLGCAITAEGGVACWELSLPLHPDIPEPRYDSPVIAPERVPIRGEVVELATSDHAACARTKNGPVYCWGSANWTKSGAEPTPVAALEGSTRLILSTMAACGVIDERRSSCTDKVGRTMEILRESLPESKRDTTGGVAERVEVADSECFRTFNGGVRCDDLAWPGARYGEFAADYEGLCAITGGRVHCGRVSYAALVGPSRNPDGRPSLQPPHSIVGIDDAVSVARGRRFTCALRADHSVWCWGANSRGQSGVARPYVRAKPVLGVADAVALDVDGFQACALERGGAVKCWRASASRRRAVLHTRRAYDYFDNPFYERYAAEAVGTAPRGPLRLGRWHERDRPGAAGKPAAPHTFRCVLGPDGSSRCGGACPKMPVPMTCDET